MLTGTSLISLLQDPAIRVLSVDCFDTLLLRNGQPEIEKFHVIANRLAILPICREQQYSPNILLQSRLHAIEVAYRTAPFTDGGREASINHILKIQLAWLGLDESYTEDFLSTEIEIEATSLKPNAYIALICQDAIALGKTVIIASDMYLDSSSICTLLSRHKLNQLIKRLYVSAECGATKRGGGLFHFISEREAVTTSAILHIGDCRRADYQVPKSLGLNAYWIPRGWGWRAMRFLRKNLARTRYHLL